MRFKDLKIKTKVLGAVAVVLGLTLLVMGIYQYALSYNMKAFGGLIEAEMAMETHAERTEKEMLLARRSEKDFLMRMDKKYIAKVQKSVQGVIHQAELTQEAAKKGGHDDVVKMVEEIINKAEEYEKVFLEVAHAEEVKGLDHNSGLQGKFRKVAGEFQEMVKEHAVENLIIDWLQMRRYEKDYHRTGQEKYRIKFQAALDKYATHLEKSSCEVESKKTQERALKVYRDAMVKFMTTAEGQEREDIYKTMRGAAGEMGKAITEVYVPDVKALVLEMRKNEKDYMLRGDEKYIKQTHSSINKIISAFHSAGILKEYEEEADTALTAYKEAFDAMVEEDGIVDEYVEEMRAATHAIEPIIEEIVKVAAETAATSHGDIRSSAQASAVIAMVTGLVAIAIGIGLAFIIAGAIAKPIHVAVQALETVAQGDLTIKIDADSKDETGMMLAALARMTEKLSKIMGDVKAATKQVAAGSQELSSTAQSVSQGATEQAATVEEISSSMEEMTSTVVQSAESARETASLSTKASVDAEKGGEAVSGTVSAMQTIAEKIDIVEEISRQTNLLALNAAIEAARAGEHGKGFAVVAAEVRKLAERSQTAAQEIKGVAGSSVEIATNAGKLITEIVPQIKKTAELVQEIDASSSEQAKGIEENATAVSQLDQVIQQNSAAAEEMSATSEELTAQSEQLLDSISFFKLDESGGHSLKEANMSPSAAPKNQLPVFSEVNNYPQLKSDDGVKLDMADNEDEFVRY